jgi:hypothetical protein
MRWAAGEGKGILRRLDVGGRIIFKRSQKKKMGRYGLN